MIVQRSFIPGDKWLYIKIYVGVKTADSILINQIFSAITALKKNGYIEKWFFLRYSDPDFHLRVRILLKNKQYLGDSIDVFYRKLNKLLQTNQIYKIQLDTYNRELERYGNKTIEESESIFHFDSECSISIIKKLNKIKDENYRWMISLKMIDHFLSDFSLDLSSKQNIMYELSNSFKMEFGFNQYNAKQFNSKFRENKKIIESILKNTYNRKNDLYNVSKPKVHKNAYFLI